jgi:hypothetical protein
VPAPLLAEEVLNTGAADDAVAEVPTEDVAAEAPAWDVAAETPAGDEAALPDPEEKSPIPATCLQVPVTPPGVFVTSVTSGPGLGNVVSVLSIVVQPFPRLATKSDGREENGVPARLLARLRLEDPVMVTDAQSIYISRLPTSLNHVQANMAAPWGASEGTWKLKLPPAGVTVGHPPMYECMTVKVFPLSYDNAIWQDPPSCVALPPNVKLYVPPAPHVATDAPAALLRSL